MKPTKNRFFCLDCRRTKMLFETEKKALDFIKWNADEVMEETGLKPVRAYYCSLCMGWHLSSKPKPWHGSSIMEKALDNLMQKLTPVRRRIAKKQKDPSAAPPTPPPQPKAPAKKPLPEYHIKRNQMMAETKEARANLSRLLFEAKTDLRDAGIAQSRAEKVKMAIKLQLADEKLTEAEELMQQLTTTLLTVVIQKEVAAMFETKISKIQHLRKKLKKLSR